MERKKGGWGGRGFGVLLMKGGKGVSRGHVNLKSPPSVSDRCEIQVDMVDIPPLSRPPAPPRDAGARPGVQRPQPPVQCTEVALRAPCIAGGRVLAFHIRNSNLKF